MSLSTPTFSIILCTYNQAQSLNIVLGYLAEQKLAEPKCVELLVIDNNSSDATRQVCDQVFAKIGFQCRYFFEPKQGLSVARNRGVKESLGEILIFTDDDARIPPLWLQSIIDVYRETSADCVYGRIFIDWDKGVPDWYDDRYRSMFVGLDYGEQVLAIEDDRHEFYGKNFSLKKSFLLDAGGFDERLGRIGKRLFIGEETKIYRSLINAGCKVIYAPQVHLSHMLKDYEYELQHLEKHYRDATISQYYMLRSGEGRKVLGRPLYILKRVGSFLLRLPYEEYVARRDKSGRDSIFLRLNIRRHALLLLLWLKNPRM